MKKQLYRKIGDGFIAGKWHEDEDTLAMSDAQARHPLLEEVIKPASQAPASEPATADDKQDTKAKNSRAEGSRATGSK